MRFGTLMAATAAAFACTGTAQAATLQIHMLGEAGDLADVEYTAGRSEINDLRMSWDAATGTLSVRDDGIAIALLGEAATRCTGAGGRLSCALAGSTPHWVGATLADGADASRVRLEEDGVAIGYVRVDGGPGDDVLRAQAEESRLDGGRGDDTLLGEDGRDHLHGGFGRDETRGGAGEDSVGYDEYELTNGTVVGPYPTESFPGVPGVSVTMDGVADDGMRWEGDNVHADVEHAFGSPFDDVIVGNDGANLLYGAGGNDLVDGGGGADLVFGGTGDDTLVGGPGRDLLADAFAISGGGDDVYRAVDGEADAIRCDVGGEDAYVDALDTLHGPSCNVITGG